MVQKLILELGYYCNTNIKIFVISLENEKDRKQMCSSEPEGYWWIFYISETLGKTVTWMSLYLWEDVAHCWKYLMFKVDVMLQVLLETELRKELVVLKWERKSSLWS